MGNPTNRVVAKSAEVLINFLVALEISTPDIIACPLYRDHSDRRKMVKLDDLFDPNTLSRSIVVIEAKASAFDPLELVLCDETKDNVYVRDEESRVGALIRHLAPVHEDRRRSLARLMIRIDG